MKRVELFEFEDFKNLPKFIKTSITNLIIVFHKMMGTTEVITNLILDIHKESPFDTVMDLGSGSGGPMLKVAEKLAPNSEIKIILSDLLPDQKIIDTVNSLGIATLSYHNEAVNAMEFENTVKGLKTMIASFHHTSPSVAKKILHSAQKRKDPILIFELAKNEIPLILWVLLLPISLTILILMSLVMTLFVRPLTFKQVLFTYLIPIIPIIYAWDGQASLMRTYTFKDVELLIADFKDESYTWTIEDATKSNGKKIGYFIKGIPN